MIRLSSPMRVQPPPRGVPTWIVAPSRITLSAPISRRVRSPAKRLSCGSPPSAANGCTRVRAPMRVSPETDTWLASTTPGPSSTPGPTQQNGPTSTSSAGLADGSTTAVGWMRGTDPGSALVELLDHLVGDVERLAGVDEPGGAALE